MDWESVQRVVEQGRGESLALLTERTSARRLAETLVALANARGGTVILGGAVRPGRLGLADPQAARQKALDAALLCEPRLPLPHPETVLGADVSVVVLQIPPNLPEVYSTAGRYLVRKGATNAPLSSAELAALLQVRGLTSFELQPLAQAHLDDIDWDQVGRYGERLGLDHDGAAVELLTRRGCLDRDSGLPTCAGLLLFGREPHRFLPGSEIIAVRYPGRQMGDRFLREQIGGPLAEQIQRAEAFVVANMRRGMVLEGLERVERLEYPPAAVREAIVNAVVHRDYAIAGEEIRLLLFSDRLEVYSPGRLPGHVTLDNLLEERYSRNQLVVRVLTDLGYIERLGYGIDRMISLMSAEGLPPPAFEEAPNGFRVTLWGHGPELLQDSQEDGPQRPAEQWQSSLLNPRQAMLLDYLDRHEQVTNRDYQSLCPDVSPETLRRDLAQLVRRGMLLKIGQKRGTYYILR